MAEPLASDQIDQFITRGFVRLRAAFPRSVADDCVRLMWRQIGARADSPETWTQPVIRHPAWNEEPFDRAVNTPRLHTAFDELVGPGRWRPRHHPGLFVIRFPCTDDPGDTGWHIDGSFDVGGEWWVNLHSRGRALLMLFLFTDVGPDDAPTRILVGSHLDVPPVLESIGDTGTHFDQVVPMTLTYTSARLRSRRARPEMSIYAIPSLCTPPRGRIGVPAHASWRSRSFHPSHR